MEKIDVVGWQTIQQVMERDQGLAARIHNAIKTIIDGLTMGKTKPVDPVEEYCARRLEKWREYMQLVDYQHVPSRPNKPYRRNRNG